ncbi:unnamed protein product [Ectocarpus sp. CCAP 1310/34]|nr:unnamed protein product [Ectocarpus sp. CCAP 1310/34]
MQEPEEVHQKIPAAPYACPTTELHVRPTVRLQQ